VTDNIPLGTENAISFPSSPSSQATVHNAGPSSVYWSKSSAVNSSNKEGTLASGESLEYQDGPRWFISAGSSRIFSSYSPEAVTDMATQAELDAVAASVGGLTQKEIEELAKKQVEEGEGITQKQAEELVEKSSGAVTGSLTTFNVKNYGARGDGITDDHESIQKTIEAAEASKGGGIVFFPPAIPEQRYKTTSSFKYSLARNTHFVGSYGASLIKLTSDLKYGECLFQHKTENEPGTAVVHHFIGLNITGPETFPNSPSGARIAGYPICLASGFEVCANAQMRECTASNFYAGFLLREFGQTFYNCRDEACLYGRYVGPTSSGGSIFHHGGFQSYGHESYPRWARVAVHPCYITEGTVFQDEGGTNEPYCFYKEGPQGINGGFLEATKGSGIASQATGNAVIYDENQAASFPSAYYKEAKKVRIYAPNLNVKLNNETTLGNSQVLTITATGGTYKLVIPSETGIGGASAFAGATTAALNWNATNAEIKSKIESAVSSGTTVYVNTVESTKHEILMYGKAALRGTSKITVETGSLTGGTASLTEPAMSSTVGPLCRPCTPKKIEVKNATGGTFTLTIKVDGVSATSGAIKYNASTNEFHEKLIELENVTAFGAITGATSTAGKYFVFFNGRTLHSTVEVSANIGSLTGAGAEVKIEDGEAATLANRHAEYSIDCGILSLNVPEAAFALEAGTVGIFRAGTIERLRLEGNAGALATGAPVKEGTILLVEATSKLEHAEIRSAGAIFRLFNVPGPIEIGHLLATNGTASQAIIYPHTETRPAAGFAAAAVAEGKTHWIAVMVDQPAGNASGAALCEAFADGAIAANKFLKPSTETDGHVMQGEASNYVVGASLAAKSSEKVKASPRGMH